MALQCTYKSSRGLEIDNAYCKLISIGLTEHAELDGSRYAFITVGVWTSKEQREQSKQPVTTEQIRISNGYMSKGIGTEEIFDDEYDRVFGANVLDAAGTNPVKSAYDYIKALSAFSTNQTDV